MNEAIIKELEGLIAKHKKPPESPAREVWIPICENYQTAVRAYVFDHKGGDTVGKHEQTKVIYWVKLRIYPDMLSCDLIQAERV